MEGDKAPQNGNLIKRESTTFKVFFKFNRILKLFSNFYYRISDVGKEDPKTTREEFQKLGLTRHR